MHTEQKSRPRSKRGLILALGLAVVCVLGAAAYWGLHQRYVPPDAIAQAERFLSLIKAGNLPEAYSLTTQDALAGRTLEQFESNLRHRLAVEALTPTVQCRGERGGFQTYGNRLRRWLAGKKLDEDKISLDFEAGTPVEVRLLSSPDGKWRVIYFQTHAE